MIGSKMGQSQNSPNITSHVDTGSVLYCGVPFVSIPLKKPVKKRINDFETVKVHEDIWKFRMEDPCIFILTRKRDCLTIGSQKLIIYRKDYQKTTNPPVLVTEIRNIEDVSHLYILLSSLKWNLQTKFS
jgi:hypothetical protein